jgi:hypothetical protein
MSRHADSISQPAHSEVRFRQRGGGPPIGVHRDNVEASRGPLARRRRASAAPPAQRRSGRNARVRSFEAFDVMSMPDTWEYPWFAAWDLAFHCVALVHVDPAFAKYRTQCPAPGIW